MDFSQKLKNLMQREDLSNYQLAKDLGCHQSTVKYWLDGTQTPRRPMKAAIAKYFGVPKEYLFAEEKKDAPSDNFVFYDKFVALCNERGISPKRAVMEMGLSNSLATKWKKYGSTPGGDTLIKISDYFGVPMDYFKGEKKDAPSDNEEALLEMLRSSTATRALLHTVSRMTDDEIMAYVDFIARTRGEK